MSKKSPAAESKAIFNDLNKLEQEMKTGTALPLADGNYTQPARYYEVDPDDDRVQAKMHLTKMARTNERGQAIGNQVLVTDDDIRYVLRQTSKEELASWDAWFQQTLLMGADPLRIQQAKQLNPDWFKRREEELERQVDLVNRLAKLALHGPTTQNDLKILYLLSQGRGSIPDLDLWFPTLAKEKLAALKTSKHAINQGYFNPRKATNTTYKLAFGRGQAPLALPLNQNIQAATTLAPANQPATYGFY